ncbi:MAG: hypothetical protein HWD61_13455 [Parachlamydiaceae bacterium]|nr:MAG: hypothetical protein HWD61_13455 [Parachlamydiaceae bacterium]
MADTAAAVAAKTEPTTKVATVATLWPFQLLSIFGFIVSFCCSSPKFNAFVHH